MRADFDVECQGIEMEWEICQPQTSFKDFTKSTWHTFTTPAYFDYLGILLSETTGIYNRPDYTVGYRLFEGNSETTPIADLVQISGCDSMRTNGYYPGQKSYKCGALKPNTTYTIQLVYHKDFIKTMRLCLTWDGTSPTKGPLPVTSLAAGNKMGALNASAGGIYNYAADTLACNSRHQAFCGPGMEPEGFKFTNNYRYNLSTFFSFSLKTSSSLEFQVTTGPCEQVQTYIRVYKQPLGAGCTELDTSKIVGEFLYQGALNCLDPGDYIVQVMGSDSLAVRGRYTYSSLTTSSPLCLFQHLARDASLRIRAFTEVPTNRFSMNAPGKVNQINANGAGILQPLTPKVTYAGLPDTFGCANTLMPNDAALCNENEKAVFRAFNVADSGILYHSNVSAYNFKVYKGDINELAIAQNKFLPGQKVDGLVPYSKCSYYTNYIYLRNTCLVPGTYTLANFGSSAMIGNVINHRITFLKVESKFMNPAAPDDLGNVIDSMAKYGRNNIVSKTDTFSCRENPVTIDGKAPCIISGFPANKLLYRQFYLSKPARLSITDGGTYGVQRLYRGKVSESGIAGLKAMPAPWDCFNSASTSSNQCDVMDEGWYTIVTYESGPTYENPLGREPGNSQNTSIGLSNTVTVTVTPACARPKFNRPYKASVAVNGQPHNVDWKEQATHAPAYPVTGTTINLPTENFDCSNDTPFVSHPVLNCAPAATGVNQLTKVGYYVWQITRSSYIQITLPSGSWGVVYALDVRNDSALLTSATPIQSCTDKSAYIQLCKMQPGVYTLAVFGRASMVCNAVTPEFYVDSAGFSRFDHAYNAYDFGTLIPDKAFRNGKPGDTNPLHPNRAASNDFFYCTTGAQERDPGNASCMTMLVPEIYQNENNISLFPDASKSFNTTYIARRNLWYTFTINDPGTVYIKVENKTPGKMHQVPFAVYKSDVDGALNFDQVKAAGEVDSTIAQGLTYLGNNLTGHYCYANQQITIYNDPCTFKPTRYYVLVENRNPYWAAGVHTMNPNSQVEVSLRLDSVQVTKPKFDYYSKASDLGTLGAGKFTGESDNFTCASRNLLDPVNGTLNGCQKTLWYKFTTTVTGNIRYRVSYNATNYSTNNQLQLYQQITPGDSTSKGLQFLPAVTTESSGGFTWMRRCISPGTYYLLLPGCNAVNETVYPEIEILEQEGDFCSTPKSTQLNGAGVRVLPVIIDCHTIGTDYGEFNPTLTCPALGDRTKYKTTWYRLDIGGNDTLDVTVYIDEKTNAGSSEIKYRMMTGTCAAMQEQSCVQDALTRNTYKCLAPGHSYYIQVITPLVQSNNANIAITGSIDLNIEAIVHQDVCNPASPCIAVANFTPQFDCTKDRDVAFYNYSTYGTDISYKWDFGFNNQISNEVSPQFFYPALTVNKKYQVRLIVTNNSCGKADTIIHEIGIPARPSVDLGPDVEKCTNGATVSFDATSHAGSTYRWSTNSTLPTATFNNTSLRWVQVTYNNCVVRDSVNIWINPIAKRTLQTIAICNTDEVVLNANRSQGEQYTWSTGATVNSISTGIAGYYWVDLFLNDCTIRDSFNVVSTSLAPLGGDTAICQSSLPYRANATITGATAYKWQNNSTSALFNITQSGTYWVDITISGCTFRDSLVLNVDSVKKVDLSVNLCPGGTYQMPGGMLISGSGVYADTLYYSNGCDSLITKATITAGQVKTVAEKVEICSGDSYFLPSGRLVSEVGVYQDTLKATDRCDSLVTEVTVTIKKVEVQTLEADFCEGADYILPSGKRVSLPGMYSDTLRYPSGCDSVITHLSLEIKQTEKRMITASVCEGNLFTLPSGKQLQIAGNYSDTLRYVSGCDSIVFNVFLQVLSVQNAALNANICNRQSYTLPSGRVVNTTGVYNDTLRNSNGCDSIISRITLNINPVENKTITASVCSNQPYSLPSGRVVSGSGVYRDTLRYTGSCDSVITVVTLTSLPAASRSLAASICQGQSYMLPSGRVVTATGNYNDTLRYVAGCDSILYRVDLSYKPVITIAKSVELCFGVPYTLPGGRVVNTVGVYRDTLQSIQSGCDSIIISTLTALPPLSVSVNGPRQVCISERATLTATASGGKGGPYTYTWIGVSSNGNTASIVANQTSQYIVSVSDGCTAVLGRDSITVEAVPLPLVNAGRDTIIAASTPFVLRPNYSNDVVNYLWSPASYLSCTNCPYPELLLEKDMVYSVRVSNADGCNAMDNLSVRILCDSKNIYIPTGFTPNGDGLNDVWYPLGNSKIKILYLKVYGRWGQVIFERSDFYVGDKSNGWNGSNINNESATSTFIYRIGYSCEGSEIFETKGNVTLIR